MFDAAAAPRVGLFPDGLEALVMGGSAGAFAALKQLIPALPPGLALPVIVVVHLPAAKPSALAEIFCRETGLPVKEAEDKERLAPGTVYFAPPDYHLLVESDRCLALSADAPVHFSRPAIDVLFESAADVFRDRLLGVILSGASRDGAAGLRAIQSRGGITVVQAPESAEAAVMPAAAIAACTDSLVMSIDGIAALFRALADVPVASALRPAGGSVA